MTLFSDFSDFTCTLGIHKYNIAYMTHIVQWCICMPGKNIPKTGQKHVKNMVFHHFFMFFLWFLRKNDEKVTFLHTRWT